MDKIFEEVARRATLFFWEESHPKTGLTKDRAVNVGKKLGDKDAYTVASIASTGYALASLAIAAKNKWRGKEEARERAILTLRHLLYKQTQEKGFFYHFIDFRTGERVWNSELSSIDTTLLLYGAIIVGDFFGGEVATLANTLLARVDWQWMQNGERERPPTMGWNPEKGFLTSRWDHFDESLYLQILALGSPKGISQAAWDNLNISTTQPFGTPTQPFGTPGPIFWHQMAFGWLDLRHKKDRQGRDWWENARHWHQYHVDFCAKSTLYPFGLFGINASDNPDGYGAHEPVAGQCDGTITPTGAAAAILFVPDAATKVLKTLDTHYRKKIWGRYGFSNALNPTKNWFDKDVIGIDLGMAMVAIENAKSEMVWRATSKHPALQNGLKKAGFVKIGIVKK